MFQRYLCPLPFKTEDIMNNIDLVKLSAVKVANLSPLFLRNGQASEAIGAAASSCLHVPIVLSNKAAIKISNECILMSMGTAGVARCFSCEQCGHSNPALKLVIVRRKKK